MRTPHQWFAALALAAATLTAPAAAQAPKPGPDLVVYTGTGIPTDFADALVKPFEAFMNEKYGVPVKVRTVPGGIPTTWAQLQTEWPNPSGDVYWLYNQQIRAGIARGYWMPVRDQVSIWSRSTARFTVAAQWITLRVLAQSAAWASASRPNCGASMLPPTATSRVGSRASAPAMRSSRACGSRLRGRIRQ